MKIGYKEVLSSVTDIIFVASGILLGGLIGLLSVNVGGIAITLSTSGGALLMGLIFGWLHSKTPAYGKVPEAALWIFDTLGLAHFLAIVGIAAGPTFISGLQKTGFAIIPAGLNCIAFATCDWFVCRKVFIENKSGYLAWCAVRRGNHHHCIKGHPGCCRQ